MDYNQGIVAFTIMATLSAALGQFSDYVTPCKIADPNFDDCARKSTTDFLKSSSQIMTSIGLSPLDPQDIRKMQVRDGTRAVGVTFTFENFKIHGLRNAQLSSLRIQPEDFTFEANFTLDELMLDGNYRVKGNILLLPIAGSGRYNITTEKNTIIVRFRGKPENVDGNTYLKIEDFFINDIPSGGRANFENLFGGNNLLARHMSNFINNNFLLLYELVASSASEALSEVYRQVVGRIFTKVPYTEMFPDWKEN